MEFPCKQKQVTFTFSMSLNRCNKVHFETGEKNTNILFLHMKWCFESILIMCSKYIVIQLKTALFQTDIVAIFRQQTKSETHSLNDDLNAMSITMETI